MADSPHLKERVPILPLIHSTSLACLLTRSLTHSPYVQSKIVYQPLISFLAWSLPPPPCSPSG